MPVPTGFRYSSDQNPEWLDVPALMDMVADVKAAA